MFIITTKQVQARLESEGTLIVDPRTGRSSIPDDVLVDLGVMFEGPIQFSNVSMAKLHGRI